MNERKASQKIKGDWGKFTSPKSRGKKAQGTQFLRTPIQFTLAGDFWGKCSFWNQLYYSTLRCLLVYSIDPSQFCVLFSVSSCPHRMRLVTVRRLSEKDLNAISKARQSSFQNTASLGKQGEEPKRGESLAFCFSFHSFHFKLSTFWSQPGDSKAAWQY